MITCLLPILIEPRALVERQAFALLAGLEGDAEGEDHGHGFIVRHAEQPADAFGAVFDPQHAVEPHGIVAQAR